MSPDVKLRDVEVWVGVIVQKQRPPFLFCHPTIQQLHTGTQSGCEWELLS